MSVCKRNKAVLVLIYFPASSVKCSISYALKHQLVLLWRTGAIDIDQLSYTSKDYLNRMRGVRDRGKRNHHEESRITYLDFCFGVGLVIPVNVRAHVKRVFPVCMGTDVKLTFDEALGVQSTSEGRDELAPV